MNNALFQEAPANLDRLKTARTIPDEECSLLRWDNFLLINRIIFTVLLTGFLNYCLERTFAFRF